MKINFLILVVFICYLPNVTFSQTHEVIWAKNLITGNIIPSTIVADSQNDIYASGKFYDSLSIDGYSLYAAGASDGFICKIDSNGNLVWLKQLGALNTISLANKPSLMQS